MSDIDFEGLARELIGRARDLVPLWLPGGKLIGHEYTCGSLRGEPGSSLSVNVDTGRWADFAGTEKGGDLISLYAAIEGLSQGEAARRLSDETGYALRETEPYKPGTKPPEEETIPEEPETIKPPEGTDVPAMDHPTFGAAVMAWMYPDFDGLPLFYVARYDTPGGKQIVPWSWHKDGRWVMKGWPAPRPLYGLRDLQQSPGAPVLVVEGEKAADAAKSIVGDKYVVMTWPNGSKAVKKADWSPVFGRKVLIWPDADEPGHAAAKEVANILKGHSPQVKVIDSDKSDGWDAHDALEAGWDWDRLVEWAKPRARVVTVSAKAEASAGGAKATAVAAVQVNIEQQEQADIPPSLYAFYAEHGIATSKSGHPLCNMDNILRVFENMQEMKGVVWYDEFHAKYFTLQGSPDKPREWADIDDLRLTAHLQRNLGFQKLSDDIVHKAIRVYAERSPRNEPRDWMDSLVWDGTPRIESFFIDSLGVEPSEYTKSASKNWWLCMAARIFKPGCKVDNMVILEGGQGKFKSTALNVVGGKWYAEALESPLSKDFYMALHGKLIVEVAELDSFRRAEDTLIKRLLTCHTDRYRPPYGRIAQDFQRHCIFVGTTNEHAYLRDHTGARRFWPVKIGEIDLKKIREERDQLFAEAVHRFKAGDSWWEMPEEETREAQESRRQEDEWETVVTEYLERKTEVTIKDVAVDAIKIDVSRLDLLIQRRIAKIMQSIGWTKHNLRAKAPDLQQRRIWRCPDYYFEDEMDDSL